MRFGVGVKCHAVRGQPLEMHNRLRHALSAESVQCPKQHAIKFPLGGILEQGGELLPLLCALPAAFAFNVLPANRMAPLTLVAPNPRARVRRDAELGQADRPAQPGEALARSRR